LSTTSDISTTDFEPDEERVAELIDEFTERVERGDSPTIVEYTTKYPALAPLLRDVLPAIQTMKGEAFGNRVSDDGVHAGQPLTGVIGDFRIVREIGRGGMGVVYEAEQLSLGRRVALKTLPFAMALDPVRLNRFRNEAQAAAQLHHPNIVPVYAVGTERGVWYYAMQIVDGRSLAEALADLRDGEHNDQTICDGLTETVSTSTDAGTSSQLRDAISESAGGSEFQFIRVAVDLCRQAARGLEHAHSMDIVHRDIKPANLILDGTGRLWITDFGLARICNTSTVTATGDLIGTLAYMSPEQAMGNNAVIDHRSDIYSLGATLYELLTLRPVFEEENRAALLKRITTDEPTAPRKVNPLIPIDLETIILKCLAFDPAHRYRTTTELQTDLTSFLEDRPIAARRPSVAERALKWAKRHRPLMYTGVAAILILMVGLSISTAVIANEQARTAELLKNVSQRESELRVALLARDRQQQLAVDNLKQAEENFRQARGVLDFFTAKIEFEMPRSNELEPVRRELLEESLSYYQTFIEQAKLDPEIREELATSHRRVASILYEIGSTEKAAESLDRALEVQEQLLRDSPNNQELLRSIQTMYRQLRAYSNNELVKLVNEEPVRTELDMTPQQVSEYDAILLEYYKANPSLDLRNMTAVRQHIRRRTDVAVADIRKILNKEQFSRLNQIALQVRGNNKWFDRDVIKSLGLTVVQSSQIRAIVDSSDSALAQAFLQRRGHETRRLRREAVSRILGTLTDAQRVKWRSMTGKPFTARVRLKSPIWTTVPFGRGQ
jgi:serine/threonine protein kinase